MSRDGALVVVSLEAFEQLERRVAELERRLAVVEPPVTGSPYMTIPEVAAYLRCSRQRVDDLLSRGRLARHKEGARTLLLRSEVEAYINDNGGRRRW